MYGETVVRRTSGVRVGAALIQGEGPPRFSLVRPGVRTAGSSCVWRCETPALILVPSDRYRGRKRTLCDPNDRRDSVGIRT